VRKEGLRRFSAWCLCLTVFFPPSAWAETLTLENALKQAGAHNKTLDGARKALGIFEGQVQSAKALPNPEFDALFSQIATHDPSFSDSAKDFTLQQTIETGGKRKLRTQAARAELSSGQARYEAMKLDVERQVKEAYWDLALATEEINFNLQSLQFQQRFLSRVQENFQVNKANLADLTRARVEVARSFNDVFETRKKLEIARSNLNRLIGRDVRSELPSPQRLSEAAVPMNEDALIAQARANRPEKASLAQLEQGGKAELKLAKTELWAPDLKTQLLYQKGERGDGGDSWGAGVGLVLPVFNHFKGERTSAQAKIDSLAAQTEDLDEQIALEVHQAVEEMKLSREQLNLWKGAVDEASQSARLAEERYLEGDVDLFVFFQARRDLVSTTLQYLEALRNDRVNQANLERAVGEEESI
jgi:outer membrane protein, heavy metal efflux system